MSPHTHPKMSVSAVASSLSPLPPACINPHPRPWGLASAAAPGGVQDSYLDCAFSPVALPVSAINAKHSPDPTAARSPRQAGSSLWGLRLGHTQLQGLMREADRAGEAVGAHARPTRPQRRSQQCSARTEGRRGGGAGLQGSDPARAATWEGADPSSIR